VWWTGEMHTELWYRNMKERVHWEDLGVDGKIFLKHALKNFDGR
jgi:hypothetical protein